MKPALFIPYRSFVVIEEKILKHVSHIIMLNFEPIMGLHYWSGGHDFNTIWNLQYLQKLIDICGAVILKMYTLILPFHNYLHFQKCLALYFNKIFYLLCTKFS